MLLNFAPVRRENFRLEVPTRGAYREVLASDEFRFGGGGTQNGTVRTVTEKTPDEKRHNYVTITLPSNGAVILQKVPASKANPSK